MAALYVLIPVAVGIVAACIWIFFWAVDNGQYDDLDSPAHSILFDDDERPGPSSAKQPEQPRAADREPGQDA